MGISKRLYEEYLAELEAKERAMYGPALIDADGDHMVNCECADCMEFQQLIDRDDKYPVPETTEQFEGKVPDSDGLWLNGVKIGPGA